VLRVRGDAMISGSAFRMTAHPGVRWLRSEESDGLIFLQISSAQLVDLVFDMKTFLDMTVQIYQISPPHRLRWRSAGMHDAR